MVQGSSSEEILEESLKVSKTNGEWALIGVHVNPDAQLVLNEGSYSEIKYYVSTFNYLHFSWSLIFD